MDETTHPNVSRFPDLTGTRFFSAIRRLVNKVTIEPDTQSIKKAQSGARAPLLVPRYYMHRPTHYTAGMTPEILTGLLSRADTGDVTALCEIISDIYDKEPTIMALFETRLQSVMCKKWEIIPNEDSGRAGQTQADWVTKVLTELSLWDNRQSSPDAAHYLTFDELLRFLLSAPAYGFACAFIEWDRKQWIPKAMRAVEHKHFRFGDPYKMGSPDYDPWELRFLTVEQPASGEPLELYSAVTHYHKNRPTLPIRYGMMRTLTYWYLFKAYAVSSMLQYAERFGQPLALGYYDPNTTTGDTDKEAVELAVRSLGTDAAAVLSRAANDSSTKVEFVSPTTNSDVHDRLVKMINDEYAKCILGHTSAAEATPGKLGDQTDSLQAQNYRIESDARALEATINEQLIAPMAIWNDGKKLCRFKIRYEQEESMNAKADRVQKLMTIPGLEFPSSYIYEQFDIPPVKEGEQTVGTPGLTDPASILATQAARQGAQTGASQNADHHRLILNSPTIDADVKYRNRIEKSKTLDVQTNALVKSLTKKAAPLYASLLNGVKISSNIGDAVKRNKRDFVEGLQPILRDALVKAGNAALRMHGLSKVQTNASKPTFDFKNEDAEKFLNWQSFAVSQIEGENITAELKKRIEDAVKAGVSDGITQREFYDMILDSCGVGDVDPYHMETVFRTNLATASNASRFAGMTKYASEFPAWQYLVTGNNTCDECSPLDGLYFANTDTTNAPPLHHNCGCMVVPVGVDEWNDNEYTLSEQPAHGSDGFGGDPVKQFSAWVASQSENKDIASALSTYSEE